MALSPPTRRSVCGAHTASHSPTWRRICALLLSLALTAVCAELWAAAPPAGTPIDNRALTDYRPDGIDLSETLDSNGVRLIVAAQLGLRLEEDQTIYASPGATAVLHYRLTNSGNVTTAYALNYANLAGDDFDLGLLRLVLDLDADGVVDAGDPELAPGATVVLEPGEQVPLLLVGTVSSQVADESWADLTITAVAQPAGPQATATGRVIANAGAVVTLLKVADRNSVSQLEPVRFTITGSSIGNVAARVIPIVVDGLDDAAMLVRDVVPRNTSLVSIDDPGSARPLYHLSGESFHSYHSTPPADPGQVDAVAFAFPEQSPNWDFSVSFTVQVLATASDEVVNLATAYYVDRGLLTEVDSNAVVVDLPVGPRALDYFTDASFDRITPTGHAGNPLFLQALAGGCNLDPTAVETYPITLAATRSGDRESGFELTETGPNTGRFQLAEIPTLLWPAHPRIDNNGFVEVARNDTVLARMEGCPGGILEALLPIDPGGVVFDGGSNLPIAGTTVTLVGIDALGRAFAPALIDPHGNPVSPACVTDSDGYFQFPLVPAGDYRLEVTPPNGFSFPSTLGLDELPPGRVIDPAGSYGGVFTIGPGAAAVVLDVPLNFEGRRSGLFLEKQAGRRVVELGETVSYTLQMFNGTGTALEEVQLVDRLPAGFAYRPGSARLDGEKLTDPQGGLGPVLTFAIGRLELEQQRTLTYAVEVRPGALQGDGLNRARAESQRAVSNEAQARVEVQAGVFSDDTFIVGKVFLDGNRNRIQDPEDLGIPGVRLYLEDGTFVISDSEGKYSFYGIEARTHVLKLDPITLPPGSLMVPLANRNGGDGESRFIDVKKGELHRADFAEASGSESVLAAVKERREQGAVFVAETDGRLETDLATERRTQTEDVRSKPAAGVVARGSRFAAELPMFEDRPLSHADSNLPDPPLRPIQKVDLERLLPQLERGFGFIDLADGDILADRQINVRIKATAGATVQLLLNGEPVPESHVGVQATMADGSLQALEYVAVELEPGENELTASQLDPYGNPRGEVRIRLLAPGSLGELLIEVPETGGVADGHTPVPISVRLSDDDGLPVSTRTPVTLETDLGHWDVEDLDPREPGVQTFAVGGETQFHLVPPQEPGLANIRVSSGLLEDVQIVEMLPHLRQLVMVGIVEGAAGLSRSDDVDESMDPDGFEEELDGLSAESGDLSGGGRAALFVKGKIAADTLLTASYDSDRSSQRVLFRDIEPDAFYPVYGDAAIKGFDAQSTSKLYARVDKRRHFLLWGDYTTESYDAARRLGNYSRSLTGLKGHFENRRASVDLFGADEENRQIVVEIPAQGISGPYDLGRPNVATHSEKVEIIVRDRNQRSLIISDEPRTRFRDYEVDYLRGQLLFRTPIRSLDAYLNPIFIRVTYEVEGDGPSSLVYGVDGRLRVNGTLGLGASYVRDDDPQQTYELYSGHLVARLRENTELVAEVAQSDSEVAGSGGAQRIEFRHGGKNVEARAYAARADEGFDNPNASIQPGRREAGGKATYRVDPRTRLVGEVVYTEDLENGGVRKGGLAMVERDLTEQLRLEAGLRYASDTPQPAVEGSQGTTPRETTSVRAKLHWRPRFLLGSGAFVEYEQAVGESAGRLAAIGGDYQMDNRGRLYVRHEFLTSLSGPYGLNDSDSNTNTVIGLDFDYLKNGTVFSEYRMRDSISAREAEAAIGLRNVWVLSDGLSLHAGLERIQPITGEQREATALTGAVEYTGSPLWKGTARAELRQDQSRQSVLNTLGFAYKLNRDWTFLGKNTLSWNQARETSQSAMRDRLRVGFAYRDTDTNLWHGLARYEFKYVDDETIGQQRLVHIWSAHLNFQPRRAWILSGRYAGKSMEEDLDGLESSLLAHLIGGRVTYDLSERWDLGLQGQLLWADSGEVKRHGLGVESGYMLLRNFWLSFGYNVFGFEDEDLQGQEYTNPGAYVRVRFKFDENTFLRKK